MLYSWVSGGGGRRFKSSHSDQQFLPKSLAIAPRRPRRPTFEKFEQARRLNPPSGTGWGTGSPFNFGPRLVLACAHLTDPLRWPNGCRDFKAVVPGRHRLLEPPPAALSL